jgi:hypothetical protein
VVEIPTWAEVWNEALKAPERSYRAYFGLFPFKWQDEWRRSFEALGGDGRLFVAPVLQTLILNRAPKETIHWANKVASWDFQWIIPCHFDAPIKAAPYQFRQAFSFLEKQPAVSAGLFTSNSYPLPEKDFQVLQQIDNGLCQSGIVPPPKEQV